MANLYGVSAYQQTNSTWNNTRTNNTKTDRKNAEKTDVQKTETDSVKTTTFNGLRLPSIVRWNPETDETRLVREFGYEDFKMRLS